MTDSHNSLRAAGDELRFLSRGEDDTKTLGSALAALLEPGDVVALVGRLGAGKTRLVQAVATALGADPRDVNSPTFVLIQEYAGRVPVFHFDAYRLRDLDEFLALGADEVFQSDGVCLVEWADRVLKALPADHVRVDITIAAPTARDIAIKGTGPRSRSVVTQLIASTP